MNGTAAPPSNELGSFLVREARAATTAPTSQTAPHRDGTNDVVGAVQRSA